jgi:uncharacterized RDD family membrane protein YckC
MNEPHDPYQAPASPLADPAADPLALRPAGKWRRLGTNLIDSVCFTVLTMLVVVVLFLAVGEQQALALLEGWRESVVSLAVTVGYYVFFEGLLGRTPGKFACGTQVVDEKGGPPRLGQVIGRTFARFVPFEPLSLLFSPDDERTGWHDRWPRTRVVLVSGRG